MRAESTFVPKDDADDEDDDVDDTEPTGMEKEGGCVYAYSL